MSETEKDPNDQGEEKTTEQPANEPSGTEQAPQGDEKQPVT